MPSFRVGTVDSVLEARPGLQRVLVALENGSLEHAEPERAYVLTMLTGEVAIGDRVIVNTTAVDLGLGTGGWHVVHWNLAREEWHERGPGHILKSRYTSLQSDIGSAEEHAAELTDVVSIDGMPVVGAALHSQLPAIVVALKHARPDLRVAYVMTDAAALPIVFSDLVDALRARGLIDVTVTCGHAFGGDYEAVSLYSALAVARHLGDADVAVVAMGPGIVGTATRLGFSGIELGPILDAAAGLGGVPVACLRASFADPRERHCGVSHHALTALTVACRARVLVALPAVGGDGQARLQADLDAAGIGDRHDVIAIEPPDILRLFVEQELTVSSMGRPAPSDPILYQAAAAAGVLAARYARAAATTRDAR
jgi:Protein of unknown function (DUF3866)